MKRTLLFCISIIFVFCSCNSHNKTQSYSSINSSSNSSSSNTDSLSITSSAIDKIVISDDDTDIEHQGEYNLNADTVLAEELYDCSYYTMPDTINSYEYNICGVYEQKPIVVLYPSEINCETPEMEYGIFDPEEGKFSSLIDDCENTFYLCSNERYLVFTTSENDIDSIYYYDIQTQTKNPFFYYADGISKTADSPIINGNNIYFDVYTYNDDGTVCIPMVYKYDIDTGELILIHENAMKPMYTDNTLKIITYNEVSKEYDMIVNVSQADDNGFQNKDSVRDISCCGNDIFAITSDTGHDCSVKNLKEDNVILSTFSENGDLISNMAANEYNVIWYDITGNENIPCIFNVAANKIVTFNKITPCYYRTFINQKYGLILNTTSGPNYEICLFSAKEG